MSDGTLYGIGLGPGDPGLVTVQAAGLIGRLNLLCIPRVRGRAKSAALDILKGLADLSGKDILFADYPLTRDGRSRETFWDEFADTLAARLADGDDIGYCTIGDPLVYSTWGRLLRAMRGRNVRTATVPGLSSFSVAAARAGMPLAESEGGFTVCPASGGMDALADAIDRSDCTVIMKIGNRYGDVVALLREKGLLSSSLYAGRVGTPQERIEMNPPGPISDEGDRGDLSLIIVRRGWHR
jgi:precorrin-2/cobalt-factor-2 C20-methyltransferase